MRIEIEIPDGLDICKGDGALAMIIKSEVWGATEATRICELMNNALATGLMQA